jgi:hypothetical protein
MERNYWRMKRMDETPYVRVVPRGVVVRDYMEDVQLVISNPEIYTPSRKTSAVSNVTYQYIYVSVTS